MLERTITGKVLGLNLKKRGVEALDNVGMRCSAQGNLEGIVPLLPSRTHADSLRLFNFLSPECYRSF